MGKTNLHRTQVPNDIQYPKEISRAEMLKHVAAKHEFTDEEVERLIGDTQEELEASAVTIVGQKIDDALRAGNSMKALKMSRRLAGLKTHL